MFEFPNTIPLLQFVSLITLSNTMLNNVDDDTSPCHRPVISVAEPDISDATFILTSVFRRMTSINFISLLGKLNSFNMLKRLCR